MTACAHCVDQREHPSFVMLLEAIDAQTGTVRVQWEHSQQPLRFLLTQPWQMKLVVGPFHHAQRAARFQTVLQRVCSDSTADSQSGAIALAQKWVEIEGGIADANELHVYATDATTTTTRKEDAAAHSLQLVREAVHVLAS